MTDDKLFKIQLLQTHKRRLQALELKAASMGLAADPAILIEIEDIQGKISLLEKSIIELPENQIILENPQINERIDNVDQMIQNLKDDVGAKNISISPIPNNPISTKTIRKILTRYFTDDEIRALVYDNYRDLYDTLSSLTTKSMMIQSIIEYCDRRNELESIYNLLVSERPNIQFNNNI